jgi:hypothetical protein
LLLASPTLNPPLPAAVLSVTEQESVVEPVNDEFEQVMPVSVGTRASNCRENICVALPAVAVNVAVCAVVTAETVAENPVVLEPAGTVTVEGTATAELLLDKLTV